MAETIKNFPIRKYVKYDKRTGKIESTIVTSTETPPPWDDPLVLPELAETENMKVDLMTFKLVSDFDNIMVIKNKKDNSSVNWILIFEFVQTITLFGILGFLIFRLGIT